MKETIQKMVNLWWKDSIEQNLEENLSSTSPGTQYESKEQVSPVSFKLTLEREFPNFQFTYSSYSDEWIFLT